MTSRAEIRGVLRPFYQEAEAADVAAALLGAAAAVNSVLTGQVTDAVKKDTAQILLDFTSGLNSNPFWLRHAGYIMPVYTNAVMSWLQSYNYAQREATDADRLAFLTTRNVLAEVAVAVLYCSKGAGAVLETGPALRAALINLRM